MIHYYVMKLDCDCSKEQSQALYGSLPSERKERIDKMKVEHLRKKRILTDSFLLYGISVATGISREQIRFCYNENGKPMLDASCGLEHVHFNLSHAGDYAVLVVADREIGVDIEKLRNNRLSVAKRFFCEEEYNHIMQCSEEMRDACFLKYWTMKEAYVKRIGTGLSVPLNSFVVEQDKYLCIYPFRQDRYCVSVYGLKQDEIQQIKKENDNPSDLFRELTFGEICTL